MIKQILFIIFVVPLTIILSLLGTGFALLWGFVELGITCLFGLVVGILLAVIRLGDHLAGFKQNDKKDDHSHKS